MVIQEWIVFDSEQFLIVFFVMRYWKEGFLE